MKTTENGTWLLRTSAALLLVLLPYSGLVTALPYIQPEWGLSNTQAGILFSIYMIGFALSSLVLVPMADRVPPARILFAGAVVMVAGNLLFPLAARGFWSGSIIRFFTGAANVVVYILGIRLVSQRFTGRRRGSAVGVFVSTGYAGTTFSYTLMGLLLNVVSSWREAYFIISSAGLVGIVLAFSLLRETESQLQASLATTADGGSTKAAGRGRGPDLRVLSHRPVAIVIIAYALHTAELYLARLWLPLLLDAALVGHGTSSTEAVAQAATLSGLMFMTGIFGALGGGVLSDRLGRSSGAMLIFGLSGAISFAIGWMVSAPLGLLLALGFAYGLVTAADSAIYSTAAVELSPPDRIASVQAVQAFVGFGVGAVVPVVAGTILDVVDSPAGWGVAFSLSGGLAIVGVTALWHLRRHLPAAPATPYGER